jgi:hypothetical protein
MNNNNKKVLINVINVINIIFYIFIIINLRLIIHLYLYSLFCIFKKISLITFCIINYLIGELK